MKRNRAKHTKRPRPRYVVGYRGAPTVYGRPQDHDMGIWTDAMTLRDARRSRAHFIEPDALVIYKLVPVTPSAAKGER